MTPRQLNFDLPARAALGREDFYVSPANAMGVAMIEGWHTWPARKLVLSGPAGSGKTHLVHVWAALSGATIINACDLETADIPALATAPVAIEDLHEIAGNGPAEQALFHLHNLALAEGQSLLFTAEKPAAQWGLSLPDLASRMQGTQAATMDEPDDMLLTALLVKLFADRQLTPTTDTVPYLVTHMVRSFDMARRLVAEMDSAALSQNRPLNRKLAGDVLRHLDQPDLLDNSGA